jgi:hypothetical protein
MFFADIYKKCNGLRNFRNVTTNTYDHTICFVFELFTITEAENYCTENGMTLLKEDPRRSPFHHVFENRTNTKIKHYWSVNTRHEKHTENRAFYCEFKIDFVPCEKDIGTTDTAVETRRNYNTFNFLFDAEFSIRS